MKIEGLPVVTPGVVETKAYYPQPANNKITPSERVKVARERNTPAYIQEHLADPQHPDQAAWTSLGESGVVHTMNPSQGWREGAKLINSFPAVLLGPAEEVPTDDQGMFRTELNYDGPKDRQAAYAKHTLAGIDAMEDALVELYGENPDVKPNLAPGIPLVVVMENANKDVTTGLVHSARTLATPHRQILPNGFGVNTERTPQLSPALQMERRIKEGFPFGSKVVEEIDAELKTVLGSQAGGVDIYASDDDSSPLEYTIDTGITRGGDLTTRATRLAEIEEAHYGVNRDKMTEVLQRGSDANEKFAHMYRRRGLVPYSSRHTLYYAENEDGVRTLHMDVSPAIFGGGATEDKLVSIDRHPDHPQLLPIDVRTRFDKTFATGLNDRLNATTSITSEVPVFTRE